MVFATAASRSEARIAALALTLPARPAAPPPMRVTGSVRSREGCAVQLMHIYASSMSPTELRRLFERSKCGWTGFAACGDRSRRPRGRVLFVRPADGGTGFEHRWIDYDLLGGAVQEPNGRRVR